MSHRTRSSLVITLCLLVCGCGQKPDQVRINPSRMTLYGFKARNSVQTEVLDKKGQPVPGAIPTLSSSSPKVVAVEASGAVRAVGAGRAVITATFETLTAQSSIEVIDVGTITLSPGRTTLAGPKGTTLQFNAAVKNAAGAAIELAPVWTSSDPKVATVSSTGLVSAEGEGRTTITAQLGDVAGFSDLTIVFRTIASFEVSPTTMILKAGESQLMNPLARDPNGNAIPEVAVVWTSSDPAVASCYNNMVTGHKAGTAKITAVCGTLTAEVTVLVN